MRDDTKAEPGTGKPRPRRTWPQMLWFFAVFVVIVLSLLIGYRYAIQTYANDWYLFQVAKHTTWMLQHFGDHAELEGETVSGPLAQRRRATLAAWDRGDAVASEDEVEAASAEPLTPWETFRYRLASYLELHEPASVRAQLAAWEAGRDKATPDAVAEASDAPLSFAERYRYRREHNRRTHRTTGPRVWFVFNDGLEITLRELSGELQRLRASAEMPVQEREAGVAAVQEQMDAVRARIAAERDKSRPDYGVLGRFFVFIVVPECGAIEVMAIFLAAVVAFPARWWKRLLGICVGLPVMYFVNVLRLSCLAVVGALDTTQGRWVFDFAHEYVWQTVYIVFVVAVWLLWIEFVVKGTTRNGE